MVVNLSNNITMLIRLMTLPVKINEKVYIDIYTSVDSQVADYTIEKDLDADFLAGTRMTTFIQIGNQVSDAPDYEENGVNLGKGLKINNLYWAPVNLGTSDEYKYGKLYQWGRKVGHGYAEEETDLIIEMPLPYEDRKNPDDNTFYKGIANSRWSWINVRDNDYNSPAFDDVTTWNDLSSADWGDKIGNPCPRGWRVPTLAEITDLSQTSSELIESRDVSYYEFQTESEPLKIYLTGYRNGYNPKACSNRNVQGYYWASTPDEVYADVLSLSKTEIYTHTQYSRAYGFPVRCVKNIN